MHFEGVLTEKFENRMKTEVAALPSVYSVNVGLKAGSSILKTRDLNSSPGTLTLVHENETTVLADIDRLRSLENSGELYC